MFPTKILLAVDGSKETPSTERAAIELASGTGSEVHVVHVVSTVPEMPYPHLAAKEGSEAILEWRKLKGLEFLDDRVRRIGEDLGGTVAASYYREGRPEKELLRLGREIDAGLIMMGGRRRTRLERAFGANPAEKVLRRAERLVLVVDGRGSRVRSYRANRRHHPSRRPVPSASAERVVFGRTSGDDARPRFLTWPRSDQLRLGGATSGPGPRGLPRTVYKQISQKPYPTHSGG